MGYETMTMLAYWFVNMTALNRILEGKFITASDVGVVNSLTIFRELDLFGFIPIPIPNMTMIITGVARLVKFDYAYFGGNAGFLQYALYSITFGVAFMLFVIIIGGLISNFLNRTH
jgi:hypothetical protein